MIRLIILSLLGLVLFTVQLQAESPDDSSQNNSGIPALLSEATRYFATLLQTNALPPLGQQDHGNIHIVPIGQTGLKVNFPFMANVRVSRKIDPSVYYWYLLEIRSNTAPWAVTKAWITDIQGKAITNIGVPSELIQNQVNETIRCETLQGMSLPASDSSESQTTFQPKQDLDEATKAYIVKLEQDIESNPEKYPLPPIGTNSAQPGKLYEIKFNRAPLSHWLQMYSDFTGLQLVEDQEFNAQISYVSTKHIPYDQVMRTLRRLLEEQGIQLTAIDSNRVRVHAVPPSPLIKIDPESKDAPRFKD